MTKFWKYIIERHKVYVKKTRGDAKPWTKDKLLLKWKFTNVFRNLDPGTRFVTERIAKECESLGDYVFNVCVYRIFNKIDTVEKAGFPFSLEKFDKEKLISKLIHLRDEENAKLFTNAFIVSPFLNWRSVAPDKATRSAYCIEDIRQKLLQSDLLQKMSGRCGTKEDSKQTYTEVLKFDGIGKFLAYQIAVDIGYKYPNIFNEDIFVVAGPGCKNGLSLLFKDVKGVSDQELMQWLVDNQKQYMKEAGEDPTNFFNDLPKQFHRGLNLMAVENCLCEIQKYILDKCRNKYPGTTDTPSSNSTSRKRKRKLPEPPTKKQKTLKSYFKETKRVENVYSTRSKTNPVKGKSTRTKKASAKNQVSKKNVPKKTRKTMTRRRQVKTPPIKRANRTRRSTAQKKTRKK